jgi:hypothetical protein
MVASRGGQNARYTAGFSSTARGTRRPFHDRGLDLQIEPRPGVVESPLTPRGSDDGPRKWRPTPCELRTGCRARRGRRRARHRTDVPRASHQAAPTTSTGVPHLPLVLFSADREDVRRVVELRFQGSNVLPNELVFDDVAIHLRERGVPVGNPLQRDEELEKIRVYACCQNGSFDLPNKLFSRLPIA